MTGAMLLTLAIRAAAAGAIKFASVNDEQQAPRLGDGQDVFEVQWPFCPSHGDRCSAENEPLWVHLTIDSGDYWRLVDPALHYSFRKILDDSADDVKPLADAIVSYLKGHGDDTETSRTAFAQGIVIAIDYQLDETTGFKEYPKYSAEFIGEQQGDCDDAAITTSALLYDLGIDVWLVLWKAVDPSNDTGHLSTAVTRDGKLRTVPKPAGSNWVTGPSQEELLHVDAVGYEPDGQSAINKALVKRRKLGWNEWYKHAPKLGQMAVVRFKDAAIDKSIPLWAVARGGGRPDTVPADRRRPKPQDVIDKVKRQAEASNPKIFRRRLEAAGLTPKEASTYMRTRGMANADYWGMSAIVVAALAMLGIGVGAERTRRSRRLRAHAAARESRNF